MSAPPRNRYHDRRCIICGVEFEPTSGRQRICRSCRLSGGEYKQMWRVANARSSRLWNARHPEQHRALTRRWVLSHPEYHRRYNREWMRLQRQKPILDALYAALRLVEIEAPEFRMEEGR